MPFSASSLAWRLESRKRLLPASMITSPGSRTAASWSIIASVASPDGTLMITWRGAAISSTSRSSGSATAMRPSFSGSAAISVAT